MRDPDLGQRFVELVSVMARLRGEGGCPWDREQTRESLRPFLIEEAHEALEALESGEPAAIREELGDVLFQVVFHARLAEERGEFAIGDLLDTLIAKMVRRHPHVFADGVVGTATEALAQWEAIKQAESGPTRRSALHGVPRRLPALHRAQRMQHRASRVGFDWASAGEALDKVREEVAELGAALAGGDAAAIDAELGDLLFAAVNVARLAGSDPEAALQRTIERFRRRFALMEEAAEQRGQELRAMTLEQMEQLWTDAKSRERAC
jgi:tetrapyrrole methylase family protein/MazG family protein